jgi:diadenosine tetraphosphatase ApaH/serine/threonine PP2A family protein phosphatase
MRIAIIADLHANLEAVTAVLREIDVVRPDRVFCLGDLTGYNANPNEVIDLIRARGIPTLMGNHDAAVCGLEQPWFFRAAARKAVEWQAERLREDNRRWMAVAPEQAVFDTGILAVHGSPSSRDDYIVDWLDSMRQMSLLERKAIRLCFFGHSHRACLFSDKGQTVQAPASGTHNLHPLNRYFINPGSVGQPRDGDPRAAFGILDTEKATFTFHRVAYDIEGCMQRILDAGLPQECAQRLPRGK